MKLKKRNILLCVLMLLLVGGGILCAVRWKVWFGQPEEAPYGVSETPWRVMLTPGGEGEMSRCVSWQCDSVVRESWVELNGERIPAIGEVFVSRAGRAAYYRAALNGLSADSVYRYRVVTDGKTSPYYEFRTPPAGADRETCFVFVGDVQDDECDNANRLLRNALARNPKAEMLLCGGDLVERPRDSDWDDAFRNLDSIRTAMPVMAITGNHDYLKSAIRKLERRFPLVFPYFLNEQVGDNMLYTTTVGPVQFFLLDSNREWIFLYEQRQWLEQKLKESTAKWKIVMTHHPLYSMRGKNNLGQRWAFASLVEEQKVDLVLQGHEHNYARKSTEGNTTPVFTISHCSPKTYGHKSLDQFDKTFLDSRFYQTIRTHGDTLFMSTHEVYRDSLIDSVQIIKPGIVVG